jgi:tRNA dimethylallyltransferase
VANSAVAPLPFPALVGPTASGKTEASIALAQHLGAEIASVDSMLVYRGMDIGTAKPTPAQQLRVPHHLLDLAEPSERFTAARFQACAGAVTTELASRGVPALLVGGSGLYLRAVVDDLEFPPEDPGIRADLEREGAAVGAAQLYLRLETTDPEAAAKIEPENLRRIVRALEVAAVTGRGFSSYAAAWDTYDARRLRAAGIRMDPAVLTQRISERVSAMFAAGWIGEVRGLIDRGWGDWLTSTQAIGYSELVRHLDGRLGLDEAWERTTARTRKLARRQMAWFRRDPRIRWFDAGAGGAMDVVDEVQAYLEAA